LGGITLLIQHHQVFAGKLIARVFTIGRRVGVGVKRKLPVDDLCRLASDTPVRASDTPGAVDRAAVAVAVNNFFLEYMWLQRRASLRGAITERCSLQVGDAWLVLVEKQEYVVCRQGWEDDWSL
jgi:hypothetical protein